MPYIDNWPNCPICGTEHLRIFRREGMHELYRFGDGYDFDFACQITIKIGCRKCEWKRSVTQIIPFRHKRDKEDWNNFHRIGYCENDPQLNLLYPRTKK